MNKIRLQEIEARVRMTMHNGIIATQEVKGRAVTTDDIFWHLMSAAGARVGGIDGADGDRSYSDRWEWF